MAACVSGCCHGRSLGTKWIQGEGRTGLMDESDRGEGGPFILYIKDSCGAATLVYFTGWKRGHVSVLSGPGNIWPCRCI